MALFHVLPLDEQERHVWRGSHTGLVPTGQVDLLVPSFVAVNAALATPHFSYLLRLAAQALAGPLSFYPRLRSTTLPPNLYQKIRCCKNEKISNCCRFHCDT